MNILISTTTNWNPGDDFIRFGVQHLLEHIYPNANYIHYDRNPDFFEKGEWKMGSSHNSNCMNNPVDLSNIDLVVLAGSPEFIHGPLEPLYNALYDDISVPLWAIGVGYSYEVGGLVLTDKEKEVLSRDSTLIITRQYDLRDKLTELLGKKVDTLPCPAIFAPPRDQRGRQHPKTLMIPQACSGPQSIIGADMIDYRSFDEVAYVYIEDWKNGKRPGYYNSDARSLLEHIILYHRVISNRLHGGLVALGAGSKVEFFNSSNRVQKALEPFHPYCKDGVYSMTFDELLDIKKRYLDLLEEKA